MSKFSPTSEQAAVIQCQEPVIKVQARAGTGKTTLCENFMLARPHESFMYVVFNRSTAQEANLRMPSNSYNTTMHAHAFAYTGRALKHKLINAYRLKEIVETLGMGRNQYYLAYQTKEAFNAFLASDKTMEEFSDLLERTNAKVRKFVEDMWERATNPLDRFPATHDVYLKQYQLSKPVLDIDWIVVDEAQDWNPVMLDILLKQDRKRLLVGDEFQQLYAFRGAVNALEMVDGAEFHLTQSWRFHQGVADVANRILNVRGNKHPIVGMKPEREVTTRQWAVLGRTNAGLMARMIQQVYDRPDSRLYFIGGKDGYKFDPILDVYYLWKGDVYSIKDQYIKNNFKSYGELKKYVEETTHKRDNGTKLSLDPEIHGLYNLVETYRDKIPTLVERVRTNVTERRGEADMIFGTGHKAKGQEYERVELLDDFYDYREFKSDYDVLDGFPAKQSALQNELNLLYVGVTRAEQHLICPVGALGTVGRFDDSPNAPPKREEWAQANPAGF